jgi:hypothetical protein
MTSAAAAAESCRVHSSSPLAVVDQVQRAGYSESEVDIDAADLELETDVAALKLEVDAAAFELETDDAVLDLEMKIDVSQEISKQERYSDD